MQALMRMRSAALAPRGVRQMSGHSMEHAIAETDKWKKISYVFMPLVVAYMGFVFVRHNAHHHEYEQVAYPFVKKRDKEMPWTLAGGSKCDLFDMKCGAAERAAKAAAAAE